METQDEGDACSPSHPHAQGQTKIPGNSSETHERYGKTRWSKRVSPSGFGRLELTVYRIRVGTDGDIS
jgi:hypothetical protein